MANTDVTLPEIRKGIIPLQGQAYSDYTHYFEIDYTDVNEGTGSSDTVTVTLTNTPTKWSVERSTVDVDTAFAGTSGGFTVQVGTDGDPDNFIASTSVKTAAIVKAAADGAPATNAGSFGIASDVLQALFTNSTSGSPSALTAGHLTVYLKILDVAKLRG